MNKLYNEEIKVRFLSTYDNEDTRTTLRHVFHKSFLIESVLDKDLLNFNLDEIGKCIANSSPHNAQTARTTGRFISGYISWAIEEGLREGSNIDPIKGIDSSWYSQFVDRSKKIHWAYDEYIDLLEELPNAQDQALLALLWEGLSFDEIKEIHYNDIRWNSNEIILRERDGEIVELSDRFMRYITNGYKATSYITYTEDGEYKERELLQSDYLMKNAYSRRVSKGGSPVNNSIFYSRLANIKKEFELSYLTPNSIKQSGMIKMSLDLYKEYGKLEYDQLASIGDKYSASMITAGEYTYYNTTLMKEFINPTKIKELYDIDVQF